MMPKKAFRKKKSLYSLASIFQLFILIFGLVAAVFLTDQVQKYIGRAASIAKPKEVKITNLTESSFSVSWLTDKPATGMVVLLASPLGNNQEKTFFDDRSATYTTNSLFTTHQVTLGNLAPGKNYLFLVQSGKEKFGQAEGGSYQVTTLTPTETNPAAPVIIYGNIIDENKNRKGEVLVYLTTKNSLPLSSFSDQNGNFILAVTNSRTNDLRNFYLPKENDKALLILASDTENILEKEIILSGSDQNLGSFTLLSGKSLLTTPQEKNILKEESVSKKLNLFQRIILFFERLFKK